jgi:hypothetical protein
MPEAMTHLLNSPRDDGFYFFSLFPRTGDISERWARGDYLVGVQVNDPSGRGQDLGLLQVPAPGATDKKVLAAPTIASLDPASVQQAWEGVLKVDGSNFDSGSFVLIDGRVPRTTYKSASLLEADVKSNITGTPGNKVVKVHTGAGEVSNEKTWTVAKPSA